MKYAVFHKFDVDGGFGDAISKEEFICIFDTLEQAEEFKKKYENPHVYDTPYAELWCGILDIRELSSQYNVENFWWNK